MKLDLGCGGCPAEGYAGVDILGGDGILQWDLNVTPWPWGNGEANAIRMSHSLEHLRELDSVFSELYRVLSDDGDVEIIIPYCLSEAGFYPGHALFLGEEFFRRNRVFNSLFIIEKLEYQWKEELASVVEAFGIPRATAVKLMWNIAHAMRMILRKRTKNDPVWVESAQ